MRRPAGRQTDPPPRRTRRSVDLEAFDVVVEDEGRLARGAAVADRRDVPAQEKAPPNCSVAMPVHAARFPSLFVEWLCAKPPTIRPAPDHMR